MDVPLEAVIQQRTLYFLEIESKGDREVERRGREERKKKEEERRW